ncbi:MAG: glycosyltransferase family 4 protein [Dehalococcoidales bacterium]|nr:glycosyltransferase family 4 protein [Dehalococcoidales bacterium]
MLLLIQPEYPPAVGGMQTHAAALARGLHCRGHRIAVVTYAHMDSPEAAAAYDAAQPFPTQRCLSRLSYWANVRQILDIVNRLRPDVIYSSTPFYGVLRAMAGVPVVCRSVGNDIMRCWIPYPFRPGSRFLAYPSVERRLYALYQRLGAPAWLEDALFSVRRELVRRAACTASLVAANSHYTHDRLLELGVDPAAVAVVPGGVDAARFSRATRPALRTRLGIDGASPAILTVCRLVMKKGVDILLEAVALARRDLPELALVVVGDGPEREKCERLAAQLDLNGAVRFVGRVPHEEIADYYHAADCFVLASHIHRRRNGWADVETMGRVICEANAAGMPVIATDTGGVPTLVTHERNGLLVPTDDPAALASAITRLWRRPALRKQLRAGGLQRAREEFDWDVVISEYEGLFKRAIEEQRYGTTASVSQSPKVRMAYHA